ncbi:hypothetical protein Goari_015152 [Gossypium aridum]|uniref:Uncharacterized protein n=1 Tax=Gossypium aridum TaxID=34290 RepID=A0A7J8XK18_GOSAI|nr:hypothetical protein [Gossypium aridum]
MAGCLKVILNSGDSSAVQRGYGRYDWRVTILLLMRNLFWLKRLSFLPSLELFFG